ncbi:putative lipid-binding protein At4g00165 [Morus notabilis]|nr:putative lipid-binding protein At4g00165 [Morus notabilis]
MGSINRSRVFVAVLIVSNLVFFTCVSSNNVPCPPKGTTPPPANAPKKQGKCPIDTLKFGVCGSWLGVVTEVIGAKPSEECCSLIKGLADLEAAFCLCTAIKANVLGVVKLNVPIALSLLVNSCGKKVPQGFVCG